MHHVAVADDVLLAFRAEFAGGACPGFSLVLSAMVGFIRESRRGGTV